jgi:4-amino-4-deoxy-L-arabinose transferase-like glycosyltransferase
VSAEVSESEQRCYPLARFGSPERGALILIGAFTLLRLATALLMGLGTDEAYTVSISREFHLSYFDHPPLHQWIVWAFGPLFDSGRLARLPFVAIAVGTSWLMFALTRKLFGAAVGVWALLGFNLTAFFGIVSGAWVLPDGPLNLFLLAAALALAHLLFPTEEQPDIHPETPACHEPWRWWLLAGVSLGLAGLSKYQAALFPLGLAIFFVTVPTRLRMLLHPAPWIAAILTVAMLAPVAIWNAENHWASFAFQAGRGAAKHGLNPLGPLLSLAGQAAVLLPWVFVPLVLAAWRAARTGPALERRWFCLMLAAPAIVVFTLAPLWGDKGLPHWAMPGWLMLFPLLGVLLERAAANSRRWPRRWAYASAGLLVALWALMISDAATAWMRPAFHLKSDPSWETVSWTPLRAEIVRRKQAPNHCLFVAAVSWIEGGKISQAAGDLAPVRVLSDDPRGFGFLTSPPSIQGCDALIVARPSRGNALARAEAMFASAHPYDRLSFGRGGQGEVNLIVIDARDLEKPLPAP